MIDVIHADCLDAMRAMRDQCVDSIVTDPPYGLSFMGAQWDHGVPGAEFWREARRVAKPGAHMLAFGGTRTYHRLACAIEDAGWEIRDTLSWLYGSGFPKSLDVSKAIDKAAGAERTEVVGTKLGRPGMSKDGSNQRSGFDAAFGGKASGVLSTDITAPATDLARRWEGWGTALKPAWEPIILARKPLIGTVAENVTAHGTGGLNVDGCRIEGGPVQVSAGGVGGYAGHSGAEYEGGGRVYREGGRWPANVLLDEAAAEALDAQTGDMGVSRGGSRGAGGQHGRLGAIGAQPDVVPGYGDSGGASRFFYCAKASKAERGPGNTHPTVKPLALMRWCVRLITPPGGLVLDPFGGSGSTGLAARAEGMRAILVEREPEYVEIIRRRVAA